ncbi:hypothetical protein R1sor_001577 [Riccia sorocarpa]|uniref:Transcription factor TFIIIC triple barrel domain-containing protein n=1 Tax=Riccia sorocarpa TaxID=122646 RepID=A0ABD3GZH4_9MARC
MHGLFTRIRFGVVAIAETIDEVVLHGQNFEGATAPRVLPGRVTHAFNLVQSHQFSSIGVRMAQFASEPLVSTKETAKARKQGMEDEEEEYVMLDLSQIFHGASLPPNCSYTLSGLDTMNPVLTLGDDLKLIGEYEETVGTILVFTESEEEVPREERKRGINDNRPRKRTSNFCKTERKLKFMIMDEDERKEEKK